MPLEEIVLLLLPYIIPLLQGLACADTPGMAMLYSSLLPRTMVSGCCFCSEWCACYVSYVLLRNMTSGSHCKGRVWKVHLLVPKTSSNMFQKKAKRSLLLSYFLCDDFPPLGSLQIPQLKVTGDCISCPFLSHSL